LTREFHARAGDPFQVISAAAGRVAGNSKLSGNTF
jgi:hypothetical protein